MINYNGQCILGSIFHNDHTEAAFRYSELSVSFETCQHSQRPNATLFTCKHCSHSSTLRDEVQKEAALAQVLQVLQTVVAAALAQVVTCERMFSQSTVVIRVPGTFGCARKWAGMKCGDQYAFVGLASGLPRPHCCYECSRLDIKI
jgi:hypothetical protein